MWHVESEKVPTTISAQLRADNTVIMIKNLTTSDITTALTVTSPATLALFGLALCALVYLHNKNKKK